MYYTIVVTKFISRAAAHWRFSQITVKNKELIFVKTLKPKQLKSYESS